MLIRVVHKCFFFFSKVGGSSCLSFINVMVVFFFLSFLLNTDLKPCSSLCCLHGDMFSGPVF